MKTGLLRLDSTVPDGVGGSEAGAISLLYSFLLQEYGLTNYKYIHINQIGDEVEEVILSRGKEVYVNVRYPSPPTFKSLSEEQKNEVRLTIIHLALLRIAEKYTLLDIEKLELIKHKISVSSFRVELIYKSVLSKDNTWLLRIIIEPSQEKFTFYAIALQGEEIKCKTLLYEGKPTDYYIDDLFSIVKWKGKDKVIVSGKQSEVEFHLDLTDCSLSFTKKSQNSNLPAIFDLCKYLG